MSSSWTVLIKKKNTLAVEALNELEISIENVSSLSVKKYALAEKAPYSATSCPNELVFSASVEITYTVKNGALPPSSCAAVVSVENVVTWTEFINADNGTFNIIVTDGPTCTAL